MSTSGGNHRHDLLLSLSKAQLERLSYVDFRLYFLGELRRSDLMDRFGTGPAGATRDIAMYREVAAENLQFDATGKYYSNSIAFRPVFDHDPQRVLSALSQGYGQGLSDGLLPLVRCEVPALLGLPSTDTLAPITRAIHREMPVRMVYHSMSSGKGEREVVPLGLVNNGVRWHLRAFDRKSSEFRDFVFSRMERPVTVDDGSIAPHETAEHDAQWSRIIELELVPHPAHPRPEVIEREFGISDGVLRVRVRATNAGYMLRLWSVDCSPDHGLAGPEYLLWLRDALVLYGVNSALLAPGYKSPIRTVGSQPTAESRDPRPRQKAA
jgi:hypothetical protein